MDCTKGEWEVIESKDDSCDRPYYSYHIVAYPYGRVKGPQRVCDCMSKFDAEYICEMRLKEIVGKIGNERE